MRSMISRSMMPLAFLSAGPLADLVFEPMMREGGTLANTFLAQVVGVGPGRGIGLIFIIAGLGTIIISWIAYSNPNLRNIETRIPDGIPDHEADENQSILSKEMVPATD